jgi:hypothetical protein
LPQILAFKTDEVTEHVKLHGNVPGSWTLAYLMNEDKIKEVCKSKNTEAL